MLNSKTSKILFLLFVSGFILSVCCFNFGKEETNCALENLNKKISALNELQDMNEAQNVFGDQLISCCNDPITGFYRNGICQTGRDDFGTHIACAVMTDEFLKYSAAQGNDLITPRPEFHFPGLLAGDKWCLCISRWVEALNQGVAPPLVLSATHKKALEYVSIEVLELHSMAKQN